MPATTFADAALPVAVKPLDLLEAHTAVAAMLHYPVEAMSLSNPRLVRCNDAHPFAQAAHDAFFLHYPLTISPDDIWFCIAQGFAHHVNLHAESLRHHFVAHQGKKKLVVERPDFRLGQSNPWPEAFTAFSEQIGQNVGEQLRAHIVADFSTSTPFHRAATEVLLMDSFQAYFEYVMLAGCGIPAITLTGTPDDWRNIRRRAALLASFELAKWMDALLPILDQIEAASRGHHDRNFWNSFFRYQSGSGGSALTGWIHVLFPYLKEFDNRGATGKLVPNPYLHTWQGDYSHAINSRGKHPHWKDYEEISGPALGEIPAGLASAPVHYVDLRTGEEHDLRFVAGMFGVAQDAATQSLSPSFGWAVVYDKPLPTPSFERGRFTAWKPPGA